MLLNQAAIVCDAVVVAGFPVVGAARGPVRQVREVTNYAFWLGSTLWISPKPASVMQKPAPELRAGVIRPRGSVGAGFMAVRRAPERLKASATETGGVAGLAGWSHQNSAGRLGGPTGRRSGPRGMIRRAFPMSATAYEGSMMRFDTAEPVLAVHGEMDN